MFDELRNIYQGKKVFLTGHTGFKGAWLLKVLSLLGAEVKGYALAPQNEKDIFNIIKGDTLCNSVISDLRNRDRLIAEIVDFQPDFVLHLAAQPLVRLSYEIPAETFEVNAIGTANLLDGIRALEKKCSVVLITTDKVYYNYEWAHPYRENDRLGGYDPYSASKACAELIIDSYKNSFFNLANYEVHKKGIAIGRAGNVIGGGDWAINRLMPDIAEALSNEEEIVIRSPQAIRPWQHVLEPIVAYLILGGKLENDPLNFSQAYNFGPYATDALSVLDMVKSAVSNWGKGTFRIENNINRLHEASLLKLDISKAINELNWRPRMNAELAIKLTIDWYKEYALSRNNIENLTLSQILSYLH